MADKILSANQISQNLREASLKNIESIYDELGTSTEGLSPVDAAQRLRDFGPNEITYGKRSPWYAYLLKSFLDPFILILLAIVFLTFFTDIAFASMTEKSWVTIVIISIMILISVVLRFSQEYKSQITADNLKDLIPTTTAIKRRGTDAAEIVMTDVVTGDIIHLAAGDLIPADMRLIQTVDLFISQSSLTGESEPVERFADFAASADDIENQNVSDLGNIALMGTIVVSGSAKGVVLQTGNNTYFGSIAESIAKDVGETSFEEGVKSVSMLLLRFMLVMVPIVFFVNGITKQDWLGALLFSISIAVGLTPEMLPTLVSTNLAKGAVSLSRKGIIVKRLSSIQNFGAMDILCTDKTGTLTEDKIVLEKYLDLKGEENDRVLRYGYLNSYFQTGLKNLLDLAVIDRAEKNGIDEALNFYKKVDEIPFDFNRRRMSVVVESEKNRRQLITKGAAEEIVSICSFVEINREVFPITDEIVERVFETVNSLNAQGMRIIAVARKTDVPDVDVFCVEDESDMVLIGYMGFLDPPKESSISAIQALYKHGIDVKILTGDNDIVTKKIASDVGIPSDKIVLGSDIEALSDEDLYELATGTSILAKLSPLQKERVITVLQDREHVVGYLGDGINDAQALKQADVGISVDTAVDIARESADIIMLDKDLNVLEEGVVEGRRVFGNIIKYIKITASSNFGNVFSVLIASAFLPFLPMLPIQLLVQNLLYSVSQISIPWDNMDEEYLHEPQQWNADEIGKFMVCIGPVSSVFDIATFWMMWTVFGANTPEMAPLFQSGWFVVGLLTQTLIVHMIRTRKLPFIQSRASGPVNIMTAVIMALGILIPFTGLGTYIGLVALPARYFAWLLGILIAYSALTEIMKNVYIRKFNSWI
ncbi:MAG TPA: magnesium-translocating P-type ATPase [Clostridiales bacterium]|nr:magnesium-translocating P-type ATPase [Clostridiales bacterium]